MKKILGVTLLLVVICLATGLYNPTFFTLGNGENLLRRISLFGILSIGAAFVIITGGIDLSIGSVICLVGCLLPWLTVEHGWPVWVALPFVLALSTALGLVHGLLITKMRLQPFVVTLCGLLLYRGITRGLMDDQSQGFGMGYKGLRTLATGKIDIGDFGLPVPFLMDVTEAIDRYAWEGEYVFDPDTTATAHELTHTWGPNEQGGTGGTVDFAGNGTTWSYSYATETGTIKWENNSATKWNITWDPDQAAFIFVSESWIGQHFNLTAELVPDTTTHTWTATALYSGTLTGGHTWSYDPPTAIVTVLWGGNAATWYTMEINPEDAQQLLAVPGVRRQLAELGDDAQALVAVGQRPPGGRGVEGPLPVGPEGSGGGMDRLEAQDLQRSAGHQRLDVTQVVRSAAQCGRGALAHDHQPFAAGQPAGEESARGGVERFVVRVHPAQVVGGAGLGQPRHRPVCTHAQTVCLRGGQEQGQ